jgi:hypothetical protein
LESNGDKASKARLSAGADATPKSAEKRLPRADGLTQQELREAAERRTSRAIIRVLQHLRADPWRIVALGNSTAIVLLLVALYWAPYSWLTLPRWARAESWALNAPYKKLENGWEWLPFSGTHLSQARSQDWKVPADVDILVWRPAAGRYQVFGQITGKSLSGRDGNGMAMALFCDGRNNREAVSGSGAHPADEASAQITGIITTDGEREYAVYVLARETAVIESSINVTYFYAVRLAE